MFYKRLRESRIANGLSVKELANMLNVVPRTVHYWESGTRECDFTTLIHISKILEESIDYLLGNE